MKIAVAHHSGDQVETILHNLFRGSGLFGMKGIVYRRGRIIRPLLDVDRDCILKWLADHDLPYVQDSTNDTLHYTRNRIRNQLLPEIEQYVNRGAAGNILRLGRLAAQADEYLESQAAAWIKAHVRKNPGAYIPAEAFLQEPEILRSYVVMSLLKELGGASRDLGLVHVSQVLELAGKTGGFALRAVSHKGVRGNLDGQRRPGVRGRMGRPAYCGYGGFFSEKRDGIS